MNEPIRVLNVVGRMDRGGIENFIMNVYRHIDREKVQFDFLAHYGKENADFNEEINNLGGRIFEMPTIKTTQKTYYGKFFEYRKALKIFFSSHLEYHIVHGHMTNTAAIYMPIAKKFGAVTCCIAHSHLAQTQKAISPLAAIGTNILKAPVKHCATDYFACSVAAANWLFKKEDVESGRVKIIKNGIDLKLFNFSLEQRNHMRSELGLTTEQVIGHVGRFFHPKNHTFILDVFKHYVENKNRNAVLMLVGDGELKKSIEEKAKSIGIYDKVMFMGIRSDVHRLMQAMDLFLMPSLYEGLPLVGIEAQAVGLPLLVSREITQELDITGNVCFLKLSSPIERWSEAMFEILSSFSREKTQYMISAAGYDIEKTAKMLQDFYIQKHWGINNENWHFNTL